MRAKQAPIEQIEPQPRESSLETVRHLTNLPLHGVRNRSPAERWRKWRRRRPLALVVLCLGLGVAAAGTLALAYVGQTVAVDGQTAKLANNQATWSFDVPKPVSATVTVRSSTGQTVYSGTFTMNPGAQKFTWDGRDNAGSK